MLCNKKTVISMIVMGFIFSVASLSPVQAKIYKWVDDDGKTHYSQKPPPARSKQKVQTMKVGNQSSLSTRSAGQSQVDKKYCNNLRKFSMDVTKAMRRGMSVSQANTLTYAANDKVKEALGTREPILKQIVYYVYGFKRSKHSSAEIGTLVYKQCLNGGYGASKTINTAPKGRSAGTGWPVAAGYVVTNHHVIAGGTKITVVRHDGTSLNGRVISEDKINDLALIQVDNVEDLPAPLPMAIVNSTIGEEVFTIGFPHPDIMGSKPKLTTGHISSTTGIKDDPRTFQVSVPLQSGNSGGPLVNKNGEVVGVVTAKLSAMKMFRTTGDLPQNVNYAVKIKFLRGLLAQAQRVRGMKKPRAISGSLSQMASVVEKSILMILSE